MADAKNPPSFHDAIADAAQAIAGSINAPDYDPKFAGMIIDVMHKFISTPKPGQQGQQPPAGGGAPGASGASPAPGDASTGGSDGSPPPGMGPAAGGQPGSGGPGGGAQTPPAAPVPGGMSQGLSPNPDEMRRVLADVAGK